MSGMSIKWPIFFLACLLFDSTRAAGCVVLGQKHRDKAKANLRAVSVRGGDLGQIKSKNLAELLSALAAVDAVCGVLAPISAMKWFGLDISKGSLSEHYLHGIGASAATTAISTYLAVSGTTTVEKAIGYGFIARLVSMTLMITTNKYHELGMNNAMFGTMWAILAVTTYALFSGKWEPMALTQFVSLLLGFHGAFLFLRPEKFMKKATGKGEGEPFAKDMASIDGGYMAVSGLVTGLLASRVNPEKVAGYAAVGFVPVAGKLLDVIKLEFFGVSTGGWIAVVVMLMAAIATGTVLDV